MVTVRAGATCVGPLSFGTVSHATMGQDRTTESTDPPNALVRSPIDNGLVFVTGLKAGKTMKGTLSPRGGSQSINEP